MPNFENVPLNPWVLLGAIVAVGTVIFYVGKWVGDVNAFKSGTVGGLLREIRDDIRTLLDRVPEVHIARGSPLRLTPLGESVSESLDARTWMEVVASELADRVLAEEMSPYDIQDYCLGYMREDFDPTVEQNELIKRCAYESGLNQQQVLEVLAIELRDRLLVTLGHRQVSES